MTDDQRILLDKSDRAILSARVLLDEHAVDGAMNRAYYAAFYVATAARYGQGEAPKSHAGTHARFALHVVRSGVMPLETGSLLKTVFDARQRADYGATSVYDENAAADAERFVAAVRPLVT